MTVILIHFVSKTFFFDHFALKRLGWGGEQTCAKTSRIKPTAAYRSRCKKNQRS